MDINNIKIFKKEEIYKINDFIQNNLLRKKSEKVKVITNDIKEAIDKMLNYLIISSDKQLTEYFDIQPGVGIASPQVGILSRIFCIKTDTEDDNSGMFGAFINPEIVAKSPNTIFLKDGEGCLSVPASPEYQGMIVNRHEWIIINSDFMDGRTKKIRKLRNYKLSGFNAIVFQHEYDHLDGILYIDKLEKLPS